MKNFFLFASMFGLFLLAFDSGLNKSTLNQCTNNNSDKACYQLLKTGNEYQKEVASITLANRGL